MSPRTKENLNTAMQSEAFNHAKCLRFAARARMNENWELAKLFQTTAEIDRTEHFAEECQMAGLEASDSENLAFMIEEKRADAVRYGQFAKRAMADGDFAAAELFKRMHAAADSQRKAFEGALSVEARTCTTLVAV